LRSNRELLETIAEKILETEVIEGDQLQHLLDQINPVERLSVSA
jgi:cell division protease FtsH